MLCPRCDQQGEVIAAVIKATGERVRICDECDALWSDGKPIDKYAFVDFSTYVAQFGLRGTWDELEITDVR
jgi:uncharacterized Zn finger protein